MIFSAIKNYVRVYAQTLFNMSKMSEGKQFSLTDDLLEQFINEGYLLFSSRARTCKAKKYIVTVADQTTYLLSGALTTETTNASNNLVEVIECFYESGTDKWRLRSIKDTEQLYWETLSNDSPQAFDLQYGNKKIEVYPKVSNSSENIWIYGVWLPNELSADSDEPQIPNNYHQALCDYAIFKVQMLIGSLDETKMNATSQYQMFLARFEQLAEKCRMEVEYRNNDSFQMREDSDTLNIYDDYYYPTFNHSPVISIIKFKDSIAFYDTVTATTVFEVKSDGIYWFGQKVRYAKQSGTDTFNSTTGTTILLAEAVTDVDDYAVTITPLDSTDGDIGEMIVYKGLTSFTVKNTGSNATTNFDYVVF